MTSTDIFRRAGVDSERDEQARQAVLEGRKLVSTLTAYARSLTKDPSVLVEMATRDNGSTNGKKIFWRPPIALGDKTPHQRTLCNKRGENLQLLCVACEKREDVLVVIYHEISHICFDSFQQVDEGDRINLIKDALETTGGKWAKAVQRRIEAAPAWTKNSYISMAGLINEYLPIIFNALEDARVNRELFKVRKGTKIMFDAQCQKVFSEGVEQLDPLGKPCTVMWSDYPLNAQVIVGLFAKASSYTYESWFRPEVVAALNDPTLTGLVNSLGTIRSAQGVYHLGFPVLAQLRELGFCKLPDDPDEPDESQPEGESDDKSDSESDSSDSEDSESSPDDSGTGDSDPEAGDSEEPDSAGSEGSAEVESETEADEAGDAGSDGEDHSPGESDERSDDESGDGASSADSEKDDSGDESDAASGMGGSSDPEAVGEDDLGSDETSSDSDPDGSPGDSSSDPSGEPDTSESEQAPESDQGTGSISAPVSEPVDEEADSSGSDSSGSSGSAMGESVDRSDSDAGQDTDERDTDDSEESVPDESSSGDSEGSSKGDGVDEPSETPEDEGSDDSEEPIDTGADRGVGGTEVVENPANDDKPLPEHGTPEDAKTAVLKLGDHDEAPKKIHEEDLNEEAVDRAIVQGIYFETPSRHVYGVREHRFGRSIMVGRESTSQAWDHSAWFYAGHSKAELGIQGEFDPPETVLGPALLRMRVAFTDNQRGKDQSHLKSGRVNGRVLGRRAWADDERLFRRRIQPGKKSYFVLLGMDVSGSTLGRNIILEKRAVMAQAELLNRMGLKFAVIAHSGNFHQPGGTRATGLDLDMYIIKDPNQPWNEDTKEALRAIGPDAANLDGHSLEYYRKLVERRPETDKIIMYYSDGKMPAENHDEELMILQREIKTCKRKNILLLGVGIRTDSPVRHGLDTVQVDSDEDIPKVVKHLERRLSVHSTL